MKYIEIITESLNTFYIDHNNIVDFSLIPKTIKLEEPEELNDIEYKAVEEGLIVVDNLKNIKLYGLLFVLSYFSFVHINET